MATSALLLGNPASLYFRRAEHSSTLLLKAKKATSPSLELGFVTSQLSGLRFSVDRCDLPRPCPATSPPLLLPVARRICPLTGKKANKANKVSFSNHKTKKLQFVNLQYKRIWWEAGNRYVKLRISTKALKTIEKNGLDAVAKKAGIDLRKL
ncbi:hypothetical protein SAY87_026589 [Trapa incisa]|uniref:Large ribosomal subunit protein bL28c n=2 Tax=Trapa TaxID=22665 RepID=A0AAN7RKR8_TRANT|nr:hypothetical protein SAY87_026589 [Trapa incisa]KAK4800088.1 hypothetical protein SAY86_025453 [Trapa natans]